MIDPRNYQHYDEPIRSISYTSNSYGSYDLLANGHVFFVGATMAEAKDFLDNFKLEPTMPTLNFVHDRDYVSTASVRYADDKNGYQIRFWTTSHDYGCYDCSNGKEGKCINSNRYNTYAEAVAACQKHFDQNHRPKIEWGPATRPTTNFETSTTAKDVRYDSTNYDCYIRYWANGKEFNVYSNGNLVVSPNKDAATVFHSFAEAEAHAQKYAKVK